MTPPELPEPLVAPPNPIKVNIKLNDIDCVAEISASHAIGTAGAIIRFLPSREKIRIATHLSYSLPKVIYVTTNNAQISITDWATAIATEIEYRLNAKTAAMVELPGLTDCYMAIGQGVYRLTPVEHQTYGHRPLQAIRNRVLAHAKVQADRVIEDANRQAIAILSTTQQKMTEAKKAIADYKKFVKPPQWALDNRIPLLWHPQLLLWCVGMYIDLRVKRFEYTTNFIHGNAVHKQWIAKATASTVFVLAWVPLEKDGSYNQRAIQTPIQVPHVNDNGACMDIKSAPKKIRDLQEFIALCDAFNVSMSTVNLKSMLVSPINWPQQIKDALPDAIALRVMGDIQDCYFLNDPEVHGDFEETITRELEELSTWTA